MWNNIVSAITVYLHYKRTFQEYVRNIINKTLSYFHIVYNNGSF